MFTPLHLSHVTCHMSHVMCHMSHVTCHMSKNCLFSSSFRQCGETSWWRVCYQRGLTRLVLWEYSHHLSICTLCTPLPAAWHRPLQRREASPLHGSPKTPGNLDNGIVRGEANLFPGNPAHKLYTPTCMIGGGQFREQ